ncbi:hypothetical protein [Rubripirellula reticaptiva]|uniref:Uncharacterized protein n=1 Tax=Rubripirellula reticaptiva TaxID=2528013 RepID=A0A5C6EET8_9BACT|nr:hypothetical protein [Rubripirellula reticaptiva]TWU46507.1 hypothetical protein Poly59_54800 [Rubripirellula reticaptiva]
MTKAPRRPQALRRKDKQQKILDIVQHDGKHNYSDVRNLKAYSVEDLTRVIGRLGRDDVEESTILRNLYPRRLADLGRGQTLPKARSLETEMLWLTSLCVARSDDINQFLDNKKQFEDRLLNGSFLDADRVLKEHEDRFGCSLWLIESKFAVAQLRGGFQENRSLLADIRQECDNDFLAILCQFLSERAEDDVSRNHLRYELNAFSDAQMSMARESKLEKTAQQFVDFVRARMDFHSQASSIDIHSFLYVAGFFSLVDQYLALVQSIQHQFAFSSVCVTKILSTRGLDAITESKLHFMQTLATGYLPALAKTWNGGELVKLIELYTAGEYFEVRNQAIDAIKKHPSRFEHYELLVRSSLYLGQRTLNVDGLGSIAAQIANLVFDALARTESSAYSLHRLMKEGLRISSSQFADQTIAFFLENRMPSEAMSAGTLGLINVSSLTPRLATGIKDRFKGREILNYLGQRGAPLTASLFRAIADGTIVEEDNDDLKVIPQQRVAKYKGQYLEKSSDFSGAIREYNRIWEDPTSPAFQQSDALGGLFRCLMSLGEFDQCASVVVEGALRSTGLLLNVQLSNLLKALKLLPPGNLNQIVDRSLVFWIAATFDYRLWEDDQVFDIAEDLFIKLNLVMPGDLIEQETDLDETKLRRFLECICVPSVICSWPSFANTGTEGVENDRIRILEHLRSNFLDAQESYSAEIAEIRRQQAIRRGIRHIDETKIFINVEGIRESLDDNFREKHQRLVKLADLPLERLRRGIVSLGMDGVEGLDRVIILAKSGDDGLKVFSELFDQVRTRYIASDEHGLDSYIGMQIRHGTMTNQLRAIFERHNLVTEESDGRYSSNHYWLTTSVPMSDESKQFVDQHFMEFSQTIDAINEEVRTKWVQVNVEHELPSALFDYRFDQDDLSKLYASLETFEPIEAFLDAIFDSLTQRTEVNLKNARNKIEGELERRYTSLVDNLEQEVEHHLSPSDRQKFRRSIEECRTELHETCKRVSSWFRLSTEQDFYDFEFEEAVRAASDIVSSFPNFLESPKISVRCSHKFGGGSFRSFINMLYILLENVAKHAAPSSEEVSIDAVEENGALRLTVTNPLSDQTDIKLLREKVDSIERAKSFREFREAIRSEGKSGFPKLLKILDVDLRQTEPRIEFSVDEAERRFSVSVTVNIGDLP